MLYSICIRCKKTPCPRGQNNLYHRVLGLIRFAAKEDIIFLIKVIVSYCLNRRTYIFICTVIVDYRDPSVLLCNILFGEYDSHRSGGRVGMGCDKVGQDRRDQWVLIQLNQGEGQGVEGNATEACY